MMKPSLGTSDAQAMETTVAEAPRRFEEFFGAEHARLFGALCFVTGDRHEAEEIMQDAFLRMWERAGTRSGSMIRLRTCSGRR
jgi:DNA-directed RNA polymerase specialized sigma24 family protein